MQENHFESKCFENISKKKASGNLFLSSTKLFKNALVLQENVY